MSLVGRHIGRYRILEQLGQGGMSVVYKGLDTALDREVAVKVLHPHLAGKEESRKRLAREAKAVAKLHHPNILEVFDFAAVDSAEAYIVTEYIRGQTLRQYLTENSFDPPEVAAMVVHEIASALAHAHEAGVIHRDLKPENVMVREDGLLKLMDFGIAKIIDHDEKMTLTGALVGSPAHMAPEIIEGEEAGAEADIFSLGTMLYTFATTRLPFTAPNTTATLKKILDGVYDDPRQLVPTVSDDLAEIIATCLMRQPASRYSNATKLRDALAGYLAGLGYTRITEEVCSFFRDPSSYRKQMVPKLSEALVARGERLIAEKRPARALASLNQALALDGANPRALALLAQMNISHKRQRAIATWMRLGAAAAITLAVGGAGYGGYHAWSRSRAMPEPLPQIEPVAMREPPKLIAKVQPARAQPISNEVEAEGAIPPVETAASPNEPLTASTRAPAELLRAVKVAKAEAPLFPVTVKIRPFGFVKVDGTKRSPDQKMVHELRVPAGLHRFTVNCDSPDNKKPLCDEVTREFQVSATGENVLNLGVKLKPSELHFNFQPPDAVVRVGEQQRTVAQTQTQPFIVNTPPESTRSLLHEVHYEISSPGYKTVREATTLKPGDPSHIFGKLEKLP